MTNHQRSVRVNELGTARFPKLARSRRALVASMGLACALGIAQPLQAQANDDTSAPPPTTEVAAAPPEPTPEPAPAEAPPAATAEAAPTDTGPATELAPAAEVAPPPADAPKPPPYSLPWQLRPVAPGNVIRSDTAIAFYKTPADESGSTVVSTLLASYKVLPNLAPILRLGVVSHSPATGETAASGAALDSAFNFANPVVGALFGPELPKPFKLGLFLGVALPLGSGGGDSPDPSAAAANPRAMQARSAMDNAMFAVNYLTVFPGVGFAYVDSGFTLQAEVTLLQLTKVRGPDAADDSNTNLTMGLHAGYFFIPQLSAGAEIRHQRWLSTPEVPVPVNTIGFLRDNSTVAFGPRVHLKLNDTMWLRPGIALALPLDRPMTDTDHMMVQLDIPFVF